MKLQKLSFEQIDLKSKPEELKKCLESENVNTYANEEFPDALILEKRSNIFLTKSFKKGFLRFKMHPLNVWHTLQVSNRG